MRPAALLGVAVLGLAGSAAAQFSVDPAVGIWVNAAELSQLPMSGDAWDDLLAAANAGCETPDLTDQGNDADACVLGQAIASVRLSVADPQDPQAQALRGQVLLGLSQMMDEANWCANGQCPPCAPVCDETRRTLAVGRNLGAYIAAADLIDLDEQDVPSRSELIAFLEGTGDPLDPEEIRTGILEYEWIDAGSAANPITRRKLRQTHDERPNNWGGHACASAAAAAIYRENAAELLQIHAVALGFLGDCTLGDCSHFEFDPEATDWTCEQTPPTYAINEAPGCRVDVSQTGSPDRMFLGGVQVDDMRRGGPFPAGCDASPRACVADVHIWEGLQGRITCAHILYRQGLDLYSAGDYALYRSFQFQHRPIWLIAGVPAQPHPAHISQDGSSNDDAYLAYIMNQAYAAKFPLDPNASGPSFQDYGKGFGWTRYTLGEHACGWLLEDPDFDGVCDPIPIPAPALPSWALPVAGLALLWATRRRLGRRAQAR